MPGHSGKNGLSGGLELGVIIADDELDAPNPVVDEGLEEGPPERLGSRRAALASLAIGADPEILEEGTQHDRPVVADLFVAGIKDEVGDLADRPVPPGNDLLVDFSRHATYLLRGDVEATQVLDDGRDHLGAATLDVHLGDGEGRRPFFLGGVSTSRKTSMANLCNSGRRWVSVLVSLRSTVTDTHRRFSERMLY